MDEHTKTIDHFFNLIEMTDLNDSGKCDHNILRTEKSYRRMKPAANVAWPYKFNTWFLQNQSDEKLEPANRQTIYIYFAVTLPAGSQVSYRDLTQ